MIKIISKIFFFTLLTALSILMNAQKKDSSVVWTLDRCIEYALEHNTKLNLQRIDVKVHEINKSDRKWSFIPKISISSGYNLSIGRVLDATTYNFVTNETVSSLTSSISASIHLFSGLKSIKQLQAAEIERLSTELQVEKASNDLKLNITAYFIEVICAKENIKNCKLLVESLRQQEQHTQKKVNVGKFTVADLLQIKSRIAEAENSLLSAFHAYDISRLNICQLLEIEDYKTFVPCAYNNDSIFCIVKDFNSVIKNVYKLPQIRIAENTIKLSKKNIQIEKASNYPSLSLNIGYGSSYSSARHRIMQNPDNSSRYEHYPILDQFLDNANGYVSLNLVIPILNGMHAKNRVRKAQLELQKSELNKIIVQKQLFKEVVQAMSDAEIAWKKYMGSVKYLESAKEALRLISIKYNAGTAKVTEYTTAISKMAEAQYQQLCSKYEYILKLKIIDFYEFAEIKNYNAFPNMQLRDCSGLNVPSISE